MTRASAKKRTLDILWDRRERELASRHSSAYGGAPGPAGVDGVKKPSAAPRWLGVAVLLCEMLVAAFLAVIVQIVDNPPQSLAGVRWEYPLATLGLVYLIGMRRSAVLRPR